MDAPSRNKARSAALIGGALVVAAGGAQAAAGEGAELFVKNCQTCHTIEKGGSTRSGPNLWSIVGRKAGSVEGFNYSPGLKSSGIVWTADTLDSWLTFPRKMVRDTFMIYRQAKPEIRKAIIEYLATQKD
jgi:cytochrome c